MDFTGEDAGAEEGDWEGLSGGGHFDDDDDDVLMMMVVSADGGGFKRGDVRELRGS